MSWQGKYWGPSGAFRKGWGDARASWREGRRLTAYTNLMSPLYSYAGDPGAFLFLRPIAGFVSVILALMGIRASKKHDQRITPAQVVTLIPAIRLIPLLRLFLRRSKKYEGRIYQRWNVFNSWIEYKAVDSAESNEVRALGWRELALNSLIIGDFNWAQQYIETALELTEYEDDISSGQKSRIYRTAQEVAERRGDLKRAKEYSGKASDYARVAGVAALRKARG